MTACRRDDSARVCVVVATLSEGDMGQPVWPSSVLMRCGAEVRYMDADLYEADERPVTCLGCLACDEAGLE